MAAAADPLLDQNVEYYEYMKGIWLPHNLEGPSISRMAVDAVREMPLRDSDVILASYPKTGKWNFDFKTPILFNHLK